METKQVTFQKRIMTPNGIGRVIARFPDGLLLVSHKPKDISEEVRAEFWQGGPCVFIQYAPQEVTDAPDAQRI